ncbi:MAG TPA: hypothetical protein VFM05_02550 [Candidatus Saccharimonadales bacterium]|nr:hypothetical protein [Candidatus Saccharimonadales bacterium]
MIDEINAAIGHYRKKWEELLADRADRQLFENLRPVSVGWKVADTNMFDETYRQLRDQCDLTSSIYKNARWLSTMHLRDRPLEWGIRVINLMQRRPTSEDALGLDNVNFYTDRYHELDDILGSEPELKWSHESCGEHSEWISLWFLGTEAKLRPKTTIGISIAELQAVERQLLG